MIEFQLQMKRQESLKKLQTQNEEIKALENVILDTGMRLESVTKENKTFELVRIFLRIAAFVLSNNFESAWFWRRSMNSNLKYKSFNRSYWAINKVANYCTNSVITSKVTEDFWEICEARRAWIQFLLLPN